MRKKRVVLVLAIVIIAGICPIISYASKTQELIDQKEQEKEGLEDDLDKTQNQLGGLKDEHNTLEGHLKNLNSQMLEISENLSNLEEQIRNKENEIENTLLALEEAKEIEAIQYEVMTQRIRDMYENYEYYEVDYLKLLFKSGSIAEVLNMADYAEQVAAYDKGKLEEYEENRLYIEEEEIRLQQEMQELDYLAVQVESEKTKVAGLISQTSKNITDYADQISDAEAKALAYEAEIKAAEEDLEVFRKRLEEEKAMSQAAANASWRDISEVNFQEGDRYLLANLIYCEAGGESYAGQLAVGAVVINRVLSSVYPDSVVGVIYQSKQFSPVASGRLDLALAENRATANCFKAADEAMSGVTNVGNCVYFRTPVEGLSGIAIGGHIFY